MNGIAAAGRRGSWPMAAAASLGLILVMAWLRIVVYPERTVLLSYALPLLIALWHRDRRLLWGMAVCFLAISSYKIAWMVPQDYFDDTVQQFVFLGMQWLNILVPAGVLHVVLVYREGLERANADLALANAELEASNEELAAREEEISQQNEELQTQSEELEQQAEELRTQAEELQTFNQELVERENTLQTLLQLTGAAADEHDLWNEICAAVPKLLGEEAEAATILERHDSVLSVQAHHGMVHPPAYETMPAEATLASLVMEQNQTGQLEDSQLRPDIQLPHSGNGKPFRSVLSAPLRFLGKPIGALEAYATAPRGWTPQQAQLLSWLAGRCSQALEGIRLRQHYAALAAATFEGIVISEAGRIVDINEQFARMLGYEVAELMGTEVAAIVAPEDRDRVLANIRGQADSVVEHRAVRKDGSRILVEAHGRPLQQQRKTLRVTAVRDITDRKAAEERLRQANERLAWLARFPEENPDPVLRLDSQGHLLYANPAARSIPEFWLPEGEPCVTESVVAPARHSVEGNRVVETEITCGERVYWLRCSPARGEVNVYGRDITDRKRAAEQVQRAKEEAEAANRTKSQFLANMSHELRTPMNAILGMTDLALQKETDSTIRDYLQTAKHSADSLLELLNQILDLSRIEAGRFDLESKPFRLRETVEEVIKPLGMRAYEKGLELICDLAQETPDHLLGDPLRLRQVLVNLIGNAVKFTSEGEIIVCVGAESQTSGEVVLHFSVADTGVGIAPEDQERIFAPFTQADASPTRHYGGTGLGLTICANLVELMGGRIWVESRQNGGSIFHFTARLALSQEPEPTLPPSPDRGSLAGLPVLVVAANPTSRRVLQQTLAAWSMKPETAADVSAAMARIDRAAAAGRPFRLVLADSFLPGTDGFALADWLRSNPGLAGTIILMLSAVERCNHPHRCAEVGAICLDKPVSQSELLAVISQTTGISGAADSAEDSPHTPSLPPPAGRFRVLLAEDTPANQKLVEYLLSERGHQIQIAPNGQRAVELLRQEDFDVVLMDVQMPVMDGFRATAEIRKLPDPKRAGVPIVAMTAHALKEDRHRCLAAGMDAYVSKPIQGRELIELVERLSEGGGRSQEGGTEESNGLRSGTRPGTDSSSPAPAAVFNLEEAVKRCFGKHAMFREMVQCFLDEVDPLLEQIRTARARGDGDGIYQSAHRLRNSLIYLAAQPAADAAHTVEDIGRSGNLAAASESLEELQCHVDRLKQALLPHRG